MVNNKKQLNYGEHMDDDGWWASVLADEKRFLSTPLQTKVKKTGSEIPGSNWNQVREVFQKDQIVTLEVTGFNRGGVLVEGEDMQGFVPFSHLLDMDSQYDVETREKFLATYIGKKLRLKIIECVPEEGRVVYSERAAKADEGRRVELFETLEPGQRISGEVTNVTEFGVFVDLGGVEGLIHISELSWGRVNHPAQILQLGEKIDVQVLEVCEERCRVALSLKRLFDNPWEFVTDRYPVNSILGAVITGIVPFGAFAKLEEGLEGLIHVSEMALPDGVEINDFLTLGQKVNVRVLHVDSARQRLGLSLVKE